MKRKIAIFLFSVLGGPAVWCQSLSVTTLAGSTSGGGYVDDIGQNARFSWPQGVAFDRDGNIYVADTKNQVIRRISPDRRVTTIAGKAHQRGAVDGVGDAARFNDPRGVATDRAGNVYVSDSENNAIRRITPSGVVTTVGGALGSPGMDDGPPGVARFYDPIGLVVDAAGSIYVADDEVIRKIDPSGNVTTIAGTKRIPGSSDGIGTQAQFNGPIDLTIDSAGFLYVTDVYNHTIRKISPEGRVTTVAGLAGQSGYTDGTGSTARFYYPEGIAVDASGNLFITDYSNTIRKVTPAGVVTTVAGKAGWSGTDDGSGDLARFDSPLGISIDSRGNLAVADSYNQTIRFVTSTFEVSTIAGMHPVSGAVDAVGTAARFWGPSAVAVDSAGNVFVAEYNNSTIRRITPEGVVTTLAGRARSYGASDGNGAAARFNGPSGIAVDANDNLYVTDMWNHTIRKVTPSGSVTTIAGQPGSQGNTDGTASQARFNSPWGIAADPFGNLYVADADNRVIRKIDRDGMVTTLAGSGAAGSADGTGRAVSFWQPSGLTIDRDLNLYLADAGTSTIRKISAAGVVTTIAGVGGAGAADGTGTHAHFNGPEGVAVRSDGTLFVADTYNHSIRRISSGAVVTTVAGELLSPGNVNGYGPDARFKGPEGIAIDKLGRLIIADSSNQAIRLAAYAPPQIQNFNATPPSIKKGEGTILSWNISDATSVSIDNGIGTVASVGLLALAPTVTTTYTLTATSEGGSVSAKATVFVDTGARRHAVNPPAGPEVSFQLSTSGLSFEGTAGRENPPARTITISGKDGRTVSWVAELPTNAPWLSVSPASGATPATVTVRVDSSTLGATLYSASVMFKEVGTTTPRALDVALDLISPDPPYFTFNRPWGTPANGPITITLPDGTTLTQATDQILVFLSADANFQEMEDIADEIDSFRARVVGEIPRVHMLQIQLEDISRMPRLLEALPSMPKVISAIPNLLTTFDTRGLLPFPSSADCPQRTYLPCTTKDNDWMLTGDLSPSTSTGGDPCADATVILGIVDCFEDSPRCWVPGTKIPHGRLVKEFAQRAAGPAVCVKEIPTITGGGKTYSDSMDPAAGWIDQMMADNPNRKLILNASFGAAPSCPPDLQQDQKSYAAQWQFFSNFARGLTSTFSDRVLLVNAAANTPTPFDPGAPAGSVCSFVQVAGLDESSNTRATKYPMSASGPGISVYAPACGVKLMPDSPDQERRTGNSYASPMVAGQLAAFWLRRPTLGGCALAGELHNLPEVNGFRRLNGRELFSRLENRSKFAVFVGHGGPGRGTVSSQPPGITCYPTCSALFESGKAVALTATPDPGNSFTGWTGACSGTNSPCNLIADADKAATAIFASQPYTLLVGRGGSGNGSVTSNPIGINCPGTCSAPFDANTLVTLVAHPDDTSDIDNWTGACSGTSLTCDVFMNGDKAVTANFKRKDLRVDLSTASLTLTADQGQNPPPQRVTMTNSGSTLVEYSISESVPWLTIFPLFGSMSPGSSASLDFTFATSTLSAGQYSTNVGMNFSAASLQSSRLFPVSVTVRQTSIIAGTWRGTYTISSAGAGFCIGHVGNWTATITESNGRISGTWSTSDGCSGNLSGTISGSNVTWSGGGCGISFTGTVSGNTISGTFSGTDSLCGAVSGTFNGTKS